MIFRLVLLAVLAAGIAGSPATADLLLAPDEIKKVLRHGPWPPEPKPDRSNRVSGSDEAATLGELLFFDPRLSRAGEISCARCHRPDLGWTDGRAKAEGVARLDRNTQSLFNVRFARWFGWDGRTDSLWAHSLGPILDKREMAADADHVATLLKRDEQLSALYRAAFGRAPDGVDAETLMVDAAKALAAFQETIVSGSTAFDRFRNALARGDTQAAAQYPQAAQRGLKLFVGRGKCHFCHTGPLFTNGEFADAGVPYFTGPGRVDPGRHGGIKRLKASPYTRLGAFSDAPDRSGAWATRQVRQHHRTFGEFKVPSLRNLTRTAPYMHNGSLATLADVVRHYSTIDLERLHTDGERILEPLNLTAREAADLVAFLETLGEGE